jgi:hypothetical protein
MPISQNTFKKGRNISKTFYKKNKNEGNVFDFNFTIIEMRCNLLTKIIMGF